MAKPIALLLVVVFSVLMLAYTNISRYVPITVEGVVLNAATRKPLSKLHVYTRKGEEEAFTDEAGLFRFTSWQHLPLVVTVQAPGGKEKQVRVSAAPVKLTVLLP